MTTTHVVVDARLALASGIGTYIRNIVPAVARHAPSWRFTLLVRAGESAAWADGTNVRTRECRADIYGVREQFSLMRETPSDATLFWATHYNFPLFVRVPCVVTVHDLAHLRLREYAGSMIRRWYAQVMFRQVQRHAAGLLFVSAFSRDEFRTIVGQPNGVDAVVHHGVDDAWFERRADAPPLTQPYFVYVGNVKPHKNLHLLLDAFERVRDRLGAQLVIIGRAGRLRTPDRSAEARISSMPRVALLGELDDDSVRRYVRHAAALVMPSLYEGFGLPPLEAMAAGCPALVSRAGSLPEVCADGAEYFDPDDVDALASLMSKAVLDASFRDTLVRRGAARVRPFGWDAAARATKALLDRVIAA